MGIEGGGENVAVVEPDYTIPIARQGEEQFACIMRERSGFNAGGIDAGTRDITHLSDSEQREVIETAFSVYLTFCSQTGKESALDVNQRR